MNGVSDGPAPTPIVLRLLSGEAREMRGLQRVLDDSPGHAERMTGAPPGAADAQSVFTVLPDGKGYDDKFVFGIEDGGAMVGCIDVIRGYPDDGTAHVGLLLIAEAHRNRGLGSAACAARERIVSGWPGCATVRLGVLRDNRRAHAFWTRLGFVASGEAKPYRCGPVRTETVLYVKSIAPNAVAR